MQNKKPILQSSLIDRESIKFKSVLDFVNKEPIKKSVFFQQN